MCRTCVCVCECYKGISFAKAYSRKSAKWRLINRSGIPVYPVRYGDIHVHHRYGLHRFYINKYVHLHEHGVLERESWDANGEWYLRMVLLCTRRTIQRSEQLTWILLNRTNLKRLRVFSYPSPSYQASTSLYSCQPLFSSSHIHYTS